MADTAVRPRPVLRTVLVVLLVGGLGVTAVGAIAWCSVFGCSLFREAFEPQGDEATTARTAAVRDLADLADRAASGGRVVADATVDGCRTGQNTWKRKDRYAHECEVRSSRLTLVAADRGSVAGALGTADATIRGLGCRPTPGGGLDRVRDEYWTATNPNVMRQGAAGLPSVTYLCGPGDRRLEVDPTSSRTSDLDPLRSQASSYEDLVSEDWYSADDGRVLREARVELAFVVTASETYYSTGF